MSGSVHYLTPEGKEELERELERLKTTGRREVADKLRRAIREGDLSENFGYTESKREQGMLEGRIRELSAVLENAEVLEPQGGAIVQLGSTVKVAETGRTPEEYRIVGAKEANPAEGRISNESPLGKALIGHSAGDHVEAKTPGGILHFEIIHVE
jgi:transcription elongation factor GreA